MRVRSALRKVRRVGLQYLFIYRFFLEVIDFLKVFQHFRHCLSSGVLFFELALRLHLSY
ncbi:MAG: hypothetical protein QOH65_1987 [Methylobacteriaceae bacterium]|nr:hypothetical protein [Methylobacteriaceae bacterium]